MRRVPRCRGQHLPDRGGDSDETNGAHDSAASRQETEADLRESDDGTRYISHDAMVSGECHFQSAAECRPIDRRNHRSAKGLKVAQVILQHCGELHDGRFLAGLEGENQIEISTSEKGFLGGGENHTLYPGQL